jgi:O-antigen ligase
MNKPALANTRQDDTPHTFYSALERYLPWLLPLLLIFSRSIADFTVLSLGLIFLLRSFQLNDWAWAKSSWFKLNVLFWLYLLVINTPLSIDAIDSVSHAFFYLRWPLFASALAYWILSDESRQRHLLIALGLVSAFVIADTGLQYMTGQDIFSHPKFNPTRLTGPFHKPVPGIMLLRVLFIAMFLTIVLPQLSTSARRILSTLSILCVGLAFMFITGERMALLLFFSGSIVVLLGLLLEHNVHRAKIFIGFLLILGISIMLISLAPETAERSIYSIQDKLLHFADSDYGMVFRAAFAAWQQAPIFGNGFHSYTTVCQQMGLLTQWGMQCSHPHNLYLLILAEAGLVGLILFVSMLGSLYVTVLNPLIKSKQWFAASLSFAVLTVCFWPLIGGISIFNNGVAALVWLGVGWVLSIRKTSTFNQPTYSKSWKS